MTPITKNIYQINLGAVNAFVIDDNGLTLIDTGFKKDKEKIYSSIRKGGKRPEDIKQIILTHSHPDHSGSAASIKQDMNVPVYAHAEDAALIEQGIAGRLPHVLSPGVLNWILFNLFIKNSPNKTDRFIVDHKISDNDIIPIAGGIQVIYTPGHSLGHVSLLVKEQGVLIAGDICANMMGLWYSTVYEDRQVGINSILKTASFDFDTAVFGHGGTLKGEANKKMKAKFSGLKV